MSLETGTNQDLPTESKYGVNQRVWLYDDGRISSRIVTKVYLSNGEIRYKLNDIDIDNLYVEFKEEQLFGSTEELRTHLRGVIDNSHQIYNKE